MNRKIPDEDAERIINEARSTLSRPVVSPAGHAERREDADASHPSADLVPPLDTRTHNQRVRDEIAEQEECERHERAREEREEQRKQVRLAKAYGREAAEKRINELEWTLAEVLRETGTLIEGQQNRIRDLSTENCELRTRMAKLETQLAELRISAPINLANPLSRGVN